MTAPLIRCIMPTRNRMTLEGAIKCFTLQQYQNAYLVVLNTGEFIETVPRYRVFQSWHGGMERASVGELRNAAMREDFYHIGDEQYIAHFDDDDWSASDRLSVQLAHIQKCGKLAVGFNDMLMYETAHDRVYFYQNPHKHYTLGTSLFYKREAWEKVKFPDQTPEDPAWRRLLGFDNFEGVSSLREDGSPIMIQVIHGGNASARIIRGGTYFKEASESQAKAVREILKNA